jgi:hypothetical protein
VHIKLWTNIIISCELWQVHEDGDEEDLDEDEMLEALENAKNKQTESASTQEDAHESEQSELAGGYGGGDYVEEEEEEEVVWRIEGHEWIGKTVVRVFGEHERTTATCTKWAEADSEGPALWHVVSDSYASM